MMYLIMTAFGKLVAAAAVLVIIGIVALIGYWQPRPPEEALNMPENEQQEEARFETVRDEALGVSFVYRTGSDNGYTLVETSAADIPAPPANFVKRYSLFPTKEYTELLESDVPREYPPSINVAVYDNPEGQTASAWADTHPLSSNIEFAVGEVNRDAVVGGARAVRYRGGGLYEYDTAVAAHGGSIYVIDGAFLAEDAPIRRDFLAFLESVAFIPAE